MPDPAGQYWSPYLGMGNNWVNGIDPDGEWVKGAGFWRNIFKKDARIHAEDMAAAHGPGWSAQKMNGDWGVGYHSGWYTNSAFAPNGWKSSFFSFTLVNKDGSLGGTFGDHVYCMFPMDKPLGTPMFSPIDLVGGLGSLGKLGVKGAGKLAAKGVAGLSDDVAKTFSRGMYSKVVLNKPITLSRYYDNVNAFAKGRYMTNPSSITGIKFVDRMGLALKPKWNGMTKVANWNLPAGTTVYKGRAAMQFPWIGGRTQYFVPNLNNISRTIR